MKRAIRIGPFYAFKNSGDFKDVKLECLGLPDRFTEQGSMSKLYENNSLG